MTLLSSCDTVTIVDRNALGLMPKLSSITTAKILNEFVMLPLGADAHSGKCGLVLVVTLTILVHRHHYHRHHYHRHHYHRHHYHQHHHHRWFYSYNTATRPTALYANSSIIYRVILYFHPARKGSCRSPVSSPSHPAVSFCPVPVPKF